MKPTHISHYKSNRVREFRVKPFIVEFIRIAYRDRDHAMDTGRLNFKHDQYKWEKL